MSRYFWLGEEASSYEADRDMERSILAAYGFDTDQPYCDGDFTDEEHVESDGFITCYFSGPIRPFQS